MGLVKINQATIQQRWLTNVYLLSHTLDQLRYLHKDALVASIDTGITKLGEILTAAPAAGAGDKQRGELAAFRLETNIPGGSWTPNAGDLDREVLFESTLLGPTILRAADLLKADYSVTGQKATMATDPKKSILFKIMVLSYLNRKVCGLAEEGLGDDTTVLTSEGTGPSSGPGIQVKVGSANAATWKYPNPNVQKVIELFVSCQRVRCSTFGKPYTDPILLKVKDGEKTLTFKTLAGAFSKILDQDDRPFNTKVHRIRLPRNSIGQPPEAHPDDVYLAINAGARGKLPSTVSTLGMIARGLGLPERCDISGTTTDAVGAAIHFKKANPQNFDPGIYVLACATTMCMAGHHSLDEVGAGASLWSGLNYKPFRAVSFGGVLSKLYKADGTPGGSTILPWPGLEDDKWLDLKWQSLLLAKQDLSKIEFDDTLWNGAKIAAGLFLSAG